MPVRPAAIAKRLVVPMSRTVPRQRFGAYTQRRRTLSVRASGCERSVVGDLAARARTGDRRAGVGVGDVGGEQAAVRRPEHVPVVGGEVTRALGRCADAAAVQARTVVVAEHDPRAGEARLGAPAR